jgi:protein involved in polysaccharide export with SLBB domain
MEGVHRAMLMQTWKVALAVLVVLGATGGGVGVLVARTAGQSQVENAPDEPPQAPRVASITLPPGIELPREGAKPVPLTLLQQEPSKVYLIGPGDYLGIYIEGVLGEKDKPPPVTISLAPALGQIAPQPSMGYPILVQQDGTISLPLVEPIPVKGRSQVEVESMIKDTYVGQNILVKGKERVLVSIARPRVHRVTVVRRDAAGTAPSRPRSVQLELPAYENDVLNALAKSGGLPAVDADTHVTIQRNRTRTANDPAPTNEVRIPLRARPSEPTPKEEDIILQNGDVVIVESRSLDQKPAQLTESPPLLTFAVASPDGRVLIQMPGAGAAGPWQLFDAAKVTATESDGRAVDAKALAERLKSMTTVLVAVDGKNPTAAHLQAVKPGTLVLTVQTTH